VPRYFYVDLPFTCVQCDRPFVFRAVEQKLWYETLGFHFNARATRCLQCRRQRRSEEALARQIGDAKAAVRAHPDDASAQLALAEAIARYFQRRQQGNLQEAIAASRKARRLLRNHVAHELREAFFWEGLALHLAGHVAKAQEALRESISAAPVGRRQVLLAKEARAMLEGSGKV
jgi:tetratricopeptide (TPR) repeat protein